MEDKKDLAKLGKYDILKNDTAKIYPVNITSIGIFQWIARANGKGVKKSSIKKRFKGYASKLTKLIGHAQKYCDELNKMTPEEAEKKLNSSAKCESVFGL